MDFIQQILPQKHTNFKMESLNSFLSLISPPPPSNSSSLLSALRSRSTSSLAGINRPRPYPELSLLKEELATMSNGSWSSNGRPLERRSSDASPHFVNSSYLVNMPASGSDLTSSSLIGAMGESTTHSRRSVPPNVMWDINAQPNMAMPNISAYPAPGNGSLSFSGMNPSLITMEDYRNNSSPVSMSSHSPNYQPPVNNGMAYQSMSPYPSPYPSPASPPEYADELHRLRRRVRELELERNERNRDYSLIGRPAAGGLPTPLPSPSFQAQWKARTDARKKYFCSLNRAGNALCAWHDSRRERRAFAPRQAPPGYLNCGCTFEEALFEESLTRNNVGSYHPGETVRMDPALRNPLLKLLQKRYGYQDGDFEHDPNTERWVDGQSPSIWEQKANSGHTVRRRAEAERQ